MEGLSFLKFWRPTTTTTTTMEVEATPSLVICSESEFDEGDDSFFELELTVSDLQQQQQQTTNATLSSLSSTDVLLSKRKILPIEPSSSSKPHSPISFFKSVPKPRVDTYTFKKSKSTATLKIEKAGETEKTETPRKQSKLFTIKFRVGEEASNISLSSSKRFSKDVIRKYLKLIKPLLYVKASKKKNEKMGFSGEIKTEATSFSSSSPAKKDKGNIPAGFKHLGKSKSASASVTSPARRDDSLLLHHDGIQSAILHCKNSFNSRDSSSLSRSTSTSSQETLGNLFSRDSLLSRFSSDSSSSEFLSSARKSNVVGI